MSAPLPLLDAAPDPGDLLAALTTIGACRLAIGTLDEGLLRAVERTFALPVAQKRQLAIERSPHHRGYSVMRNERDFREQFHFGCERPPAGKEPPWLRLEGPNPWPELPGVRERALAWLADLERLGIELLARMSLALGLGADAFDPGLRPYTLMKWIRYEPQPDPLPRPGVAPHVDFSLLTLTLQDGTGGLGVRRRDGSWCEVEPAPGELLLHAGELLQFATGGLVPATPHRVVNPSRRRARLSVPVFVAPDLRAAVRRRLPCREDDGEDAAPADGEHVHRVLEPDPDATALPFGAAEWRRKGENRWCARCCAG